MKKNNVSQAELARRLSVSKTLIGLYLTGQRFPGVKMAIRASKLTGIPVTDLLAVEQRSAQ